MKRKNTNRKYKLDSKDIETAYPDYSKKKDQGDLPLPPSA